MKVLEERQKTHGDFKVHANLSQALQERLRAHDNWRVLTSRQRESLQMICHKMARIMAGDPTHKDHWLDIAGYAQLIVQELEKK